MIDVDDKDHELLAILSADGRISVKMLAARLSLARSTVSQRLARLEREGVIRGYRAVIDTTALRAASVHAFLLVKLKKSPDHARVADLGKLPFVIRCASVSGDTDVIIEVAAPTVAEMNETRDDIARKPNVASVTTHVVLKNAK